MKNEFEDYLNKKYNFYTGYYGKGIPFECGDGWFNMLKRMSEEINEVLEKENLTMRVYQVKEKFGGLRFYSTVPCEEIESIIDKYEDMSYNVCENCGEKGSMRTRHGWWFVRCDKCYNLQLTGE